MSARAPRFRLSARRPLASAGRAIALAPVLLLVASVSGCATPAAAPDPVALSAQQGWPEAEAPRPAPIIDTYPTPPVGWVAPEGDRFWLVTWGSGSCVFDATEVEALDGSTVAVRFEQAPAEGCTDDLAPRAHELAVPEDLVGSLETAEVLLVENAFAHLGGEEEQSEWTVDLVGGWFVEIAEGFDSGLGPGIPEEYAGAAEFLPRILHRAADGRLLLVTYGSSSCPALPTRAEVVDDELVVTVEARPAEVCTADMAPTTSYLPAVDGFDVERMLSAVITLVQPPLPDAETTVPIERLD